MGNFRQKMGGLALEEKLIVASGLSLLLDSFLPWYRAGGVSFNAWQDPGAVWSIMATLMGVTMALLVVATRLEGTRLPALPGGITWARACLALGVGAAGLVLLKLLNESNFISYGFYFAIVLVGGLLAGSILMVAGQQPNRDGP
jgi:hypothetical protein